MPAPPLVVKFGGTSLGTARHLRRAARRVEAHVRRGRAVVVVVSAIGHTTDRILARVAAIGGAVPESAREADRAAATGEALSAALFAAALGGRGIRAVSLSGGEAGIRAEGPFGGGRIREVRPELLLRLLREGAVPVVAGFQGIRADGETVTLGRGGSDTSAVALAAALGGSCHIVTDVHGVFPHDPRRVPGGTAFARLEHHELVRLAEGGAEVVHRSAARVAEAQGVPLRVYSFRAPFRTPGGTRVGPAPAADPAARPAA